MSLISTSVLRSQLNRAKREGWLSYFEQAARLHQVPVSLLLAIASRETWIGSPVVMLSDFSGDGGHGRGLMQIDDRFHSAFTSSHANDDHQANINYAADFLAGLKEYFSSNWTRAVAAYNAGAGNVDRAVQLGLHPDRVTTGKDYSSDVFHRQEIIKELMPDYGLRENSSWISRLIPRPIADLLGAATGDRWPVALGLGVLVTVFLTRFV